MTLLATTALEWTWGDHGSVVFLGEWCRKYERAAAWRTREHVVVRNHWDDRDKLRKDEKYLRGLHDSLLGELALALGELHGLDRSRRFWQILLDPWLARYLGVAFDRWESLRLAFGEYHISKTIIRATPRCPSAHDHLHFAKLTSGDDDWNHDFYRDILRREYSGKCAVVSRAEPRADDLSPPDCGHSEDWKRRIARPVSRTLGWFSRNNDFVFVQPYFPAAALAKLSLRLGEIPSFPREEFAWPDRDPSGAYAPEIRRRIVLHREARNGFESFLQERIAADLPQVVVEAFDSMRRRAAAIRLRPKVVLTSTAALVQ